MTIKTPEVKIVATGSVGWPPVEEMRKKLQETGDEIEMDDDQVLEAYKNLMEK